MSEEKDIREELIFELFKGNAHMSFEEAVADFPEDKMNEIFTNGEYSFWHLLEHIRRTQHDILDFMTDPNYEELEWPEDYWPDHEETATKEAWGETISAYLADRAKLKKLIEDPQTDLYKKIPHGSGQTVFREIFIIVDHNAYHLGEFAIMRQVLNAWPAAHNK